MSTAGHKRRELEFPLYSLSNGTQFRDALIYHLKHVLNAEYGISIKHGLATLRTNPSGDILQHDNITVAAIGKCSRAAFQFRLAVQTLHSISRRIEPFSFGSYKKKVQSMSRNRVLKKKLGFCCTISLNKPFSFTSEKLVDSL